MTKLKRNWNKYYDAVANRPPRKTILTALAAFDKPGIAVDLGCGDGRDTVEILRQNWAVLAIDREPDAIARLLARPNLNTLQLTTQILSFEELQLPKSVNLINASFSLPFCETVRCGCSARCRNCRGCSTEAFPSLWNKIFNSLVTSGRFCGHLFGDRDSWCNSDLVNCFNRQQVEALLKPYAIELLEEEEHPGKTPLGEDRDWHIFHIVATKL